MIPPEVGYPLRRSQVGGQNLLWWLALLSFVAVTAPTAAEESCNPQAALEAMVRETKFAPPHWAGMAASSAVRADVIGLYPYRWTNFLFEVCARAPVTAWV